MRRRHRAHYKTETLSQVGKVTAPPSIEEKVLYLEKEIARLRESQHSLRICLEESRRANLALVATIERFLQIP